MRSEASTVDAYLREIPEERREAFERLRNIILSNLPDGFEERMSYGMIGYVVPHRLYPRGYHVSPEQPLPFVSIASQKNNIALYHGGIYAVRELSEWFRTEYPKHSDGKLDMGKSCIRFGNPGKIPFGLIGRLMRRISVQEWIRIYEKSVNR